MNESGLTYEQILASVTNGLLVRPDDFARRIRPYMRAITVAP